MALPAQVKDSKGFPKTLVKESQPGTKNMTRDSEQTFFKLSELSTLLEIDPSVLRFWEKEFKIKALKMRSRKKLYRTQELELFKEIKRLLYQEGYTIAGAKKYLKGDPDQPDLREDHPQMDSPLLPELKPDEERLKSALDLIEEIRSSLKEIKDILIPKAN